MDALFSEKFFEQGLAPIIVLLGCLVIAGNRRTPCLISILAGIIGLSIAFFLLWNTLCTSSGKTLCSFYFEIVNFYNVRLKALVEIGTAILVWLNVITAFATIIPGIRYHDSGLMIAGSLCGLMALSSHPAVSDPSLAKFGLDIASLIFGVDKFIEHVAGETF